MPVMTDAQATEEPVEELFCEGCGDQVATLTEGRGPCCHDLPHPWHCGRDGLYNRTSESEDAEDEDEEEEEPHYPRCTHCGCSEWQVTATQRVSTSPEDGGTIWYDHGDFEYEATCAGCGSVNREWDLEAA